MIHNRSDRRFREKIKRILRQRGLERRVFSFSGSYKDGNFVLSNHMIQIIQSTTVLVRILMNSKFVFLFLFRPSLISTIIVMIVQMVAARLFFLRDPQTLAVNNR